MKERPILFSGPMVRAILAGTKTQTRRILPLGVKLTIKDRRHRVWERTTEKGFFAEYDGRVVALDSEGDTEDALIYSPYQIGDRLWVRETFVIEGCDEYGESDSMAPNDGRPRQQETQSTRWAIPWYRATDGEPNIVSEDFDGEDPERTRWKPSVFMPRWASRITLEITEVRVQRLNQISEADAAAEGAPKENYTVPRFAESLHKRGFATLWNSINGKRPRCAWADNPWVWAVTFKVIRPQLPASALAHGAEGLLDASGRPS